MAKMNMLDETRNILEKMGESEEKVLFLREDLNQNNILCQQIKDRLKELRELKNTNITELEDNQYLKNNIKTFNQQLVSFAQLIYHCNQELYSDLNSHDAELAINEDLLYRNKDMLEKNSNKYEVTCMTLKQQFESIEKEEIEDNRKKELDSKTLSAENDELEVEINMLIQEEEHELHYFKNESTVLDDKEKIFGDEIIDLQESVKCTKSKIEEFSELLKERKQLGVKFEDEGEVKLLDWDRQVSDSETLINESRSTVDNCQLNIDVVSRKIEVIGEEIKNKEMECSNYKSEINDTLLKLRDLKDDYNKTLIYKEESVLENEEKCKHQDLREYIKEEICVFKNKIESQQECVDKILEFLAEHKPNMNLSAELEEREEMRKNIKTTYQQLKQDYDEQILNLEAELKRGQEEIDTRELTNSKLQDDSSSLILKLDQLKNELKDAFAEIEQLNKDTGELDGEIRNVNFEVAQAKTYKSKNKKMKVADSNIQDSQASSTSAREKKKRIRHWDSDSSVEGEDRRLSELVKQKMRKIGKISSNK